MAGNKEYQKIANISLVMQILRKNNGISRIKIAEKLNLDRSTITNIVSGLLSQGIVKILSEGVSGNQGGRRPVMLGIDHNFGCIMGIEIQMQYTRVLLTDLNGKLLYSKKQKRKAEDNNLKILTLNIISNCKKEAEKLNVPLLGIGIGVPGQINPETGEIISSKPLALEHYNLIEELKSEIQLPILIDNDANCCSWGGLEKMKHLNIKNFIYLIMKIHGKDLKNMPDNEIGISIVVNGEVYYGSDFAAGELIYRISGKEEIFTNIKDPDGFTDYLKELFYRFSLIISLLNPDLLFLGGEFGKRQKIVKEVLSNYLEPLFRKNGRVLCNYTFSELDEYEIAYGAASMFIEKLFKTPEINEDNNKSVIQWQDIFANNRMEKNNA